ncbi:3-deoxy-D-manno-octulosonic acid transferase [bacterium]|nr:3-deoxy-D-manno-octulosonic acid transferase [bacterium]
MSIFSKKIRAGMKQKLGFYDFQMGKKTFWVHAVSVGEINSLTDFIKENKDKNIVLTTSTPQGFELANKKLTDCVEAICYFPLDTDFAINNAIRAINPKFVMIFETEIWPNFSYILNKKNIPLFISNGRISDATFSSYKKLKFFLKGVFSCFSGILAQSTEDREKFIEIGAKPELVEVMGNIKFDIKTPDKNIQEELKKYYKIGENPVVVVGSTHPDEEEVYINLFKKLKKDINVKFLIAPRHLERIGAISALLEKNNINFALKSSGKTFEDVDVILLDTTGELANVYSISKFSIIAGSFDSTGGHNPLEATIWGVPAISGPNIKNFKVIYKELIKANSARVVASEAELYEISKKLIEDSDFCSKMQLNSAKTIAENSGATKYLKNYIDNFT